MRGASQPYLLRCADESNYVVKFQNNPQHVRILANEMLAARLAMLIGLPVAAPAFVEVRRSLIRGTPPLELEIGSRRELCLISRYRVNRLRWWTGDSPITARLKQRSYGEPHTSCWWKPRRPSEQNVIIFFRTCPPLLTIYTPSHSFSMLTPAAG